MNKPTINTPTGYALSLERVEELLASGTKVQTTWRPNPCGSCNGTGIVKGKECADCIPGPNGQRWGFQAQCLMRREFEIFAGGQKGPGKSETSRMFLIQGNPSEPEFNADGSLNLVNLSYIHHPFYRGLAIRKNREDLDDWVEKAKRIYCPLGAQFTDRPPEFTWPGGAKIVTGHLADSDAYEKYQGVEIHRLVIEEVAQIPEEKLYLKVRSCCRSIYPEIHPQVFLTANPEGPGLNWVRERFVEPTGPDGEIIPPKTTIWESTTHPYTGEKIEISRVFIPGRLIDNPHLMKDAAYVANLATLPEKEKRAYLFGDWHAFSGSYFDEFRARHIVGEPDNACHVIPAGSRPLQPWWHRWGSGDWGYSHEAAFYWFCHREDDDRIQTYREYVAAKVGAEQLGEQIARMSLPDLLALPGNSMTFYLSPDAYGRRNQDSTLAELIAKGMMRILGEKHVHLPDVLIQRFHQSVESGYETEERFAEFKKSLATFNKTGITLRRAQDNRVIGWQYMREMLRWKEAPLPNEEKFDQAVAMKLARDIGIAEYVEYCSMFQQRNRTVLPRWQIEDCCRYLIPAIPKAQHDDDNREDVAKQHFVGLDSCDAVRYGLMGFRDEQNREPFEALRARKLSDFIARNPDANTADLIWVNRHLEAEQEKGDKPLVLLRGGRAARFREGIVN